MLQRAVVTAEAIFGSTLRRLRVERGLSQEQLANLANLHRNHVGHIERGEKTASLGVILRLSLALKVEPRELLSVFTLPFVARLTTAASRRAKKRPAGGTH